VSKLKLFLVGGFLGSGKTTAIEKAAKYLYHNNGKVGVITNDQGTQQVDTLFIKSQGIATEEVSGGCFCCNFENLEGKIESLKREGKPDVIFAESVGSCTDLAATIINPLLRFNSNQFEIVLSVFADVRLLIIFLQKNKAIFYDNVNYIYEKQLQEADIIVVNKIDLLTDRQLKEAKKMIAAAFKNIIILYQNSLSEDSVKHWLSVCNNLQNSSLRPSLEIDYDLYGAGEAELAWLDEEIKIVTKNKTAATVGYLLMKNFNDKILENNHSIGHLKYLIHNGKEKRKISFSTIPSEPVIDLDFFGTNNVTVLINARIQVLPALLQEMIDDTVAETKLVSQCRIIRKSMSSFSPGYPKPTHRIPF
jgi:Ni2+-binding GTPase involved in maturation of urease and hydrogenase